MTRRETRRRRKRISTLLSLLELGRDRGEFGKTRRRQLRELGTLALSLHHIGERP